METEISSTPPPPPPPPLPPKKSQKQSGFALKVKTAPPGWAFAGKVVNPVRDHLTPPSGTYFLYGTLRDPAMLAEILDLPSNPVLRPAHVIGYQRRLWGQYPALVDGEAGAIVEGSAFDVPDVAAATKLAYYETRNYEAKPCNVYLKNNKGGEPILGFTFVFCGDSNDLTDGDFDLNVWLKRMRREPVPTWP